MIRILVAARSGAVTTPSGMVLNGLTDTIEQPPADEGDVGTLEQRTRSSTFWSSIS